MRSTGYTKDPTNRLLRAATSGPPYTRRLRDSIEPIARRPTRPVYVKDHQTQHGSSATVSAPNSDRAYLYHYFQTQLAVQFDATVKRDERAGASRAHRQGERRRAARDVSARNRSRGAVSRGSMRGAGGLALSEAGLVRELARRRKRWLRLGRRLALHTRHPRRAPSEERGAPAVAAAAGHDGHCQQHR
jgi:hypothetical protein